MTLPNTEQTIDCPTGRFLDLWIAENFLGWEWRDRTYEGEHFETIPYKELVNPNNEFECATLEGGKYEFLFLPELSKDINITMTISNKLGIALIPQSAGDKFYWFAVDISKVCYHGDRIEIYEKNDSGVSNENPAIAVAQCAWYSMNYKE